MKYKEGEETLKIHSIIISSTTTTIFVYKYFWHIFSCKPYGN